MAGATVEVVDGSPQAGRSTIADANGEFTLTGTFVETTRFRATKEGYVTTTQPWSCSIGTCPGPQNATPWLGFYLPVLAAPANVAGDYTLTFTADDACVDFPNELRRRAYSATITPVATQVARFRLTVKDAAFLPGQDGFEIGVAGNYLSFFLFGGHNAAITERVGANTYLAYSGNASASLDGSAASPISTPFSGWIDACVLNVPVGEFSNCASNQRVAYPRCESTNHRLTLSRR